VPRIVWSELIQPGTRAEVIAAVRAATWIDVVDDPVPQQLGLDPGETAAILIAEALHADALLIDERRGRGVAVGRGIAVIGTLGVLAGAKRAGAIERVAPVVDSLRADGFWLSDALVEEFLAALGEVG
jgi:predicted nucleic acid-binding protein